MLPVLALNLQLGSVFVATRVRHAMAGDIRRLTKVYPPALVLGFVLLFLAILIIGVSVTLALVTEAGKWGEPRISMPSVRSYNFSERIGSEYVPVPRLIDLSLEEARAVASRYGFKVSVENSLLPRTGTERVVEQNPDLWSNDTDIFITLADPQNYALFEQAKELIKAADLARNEASRYASLDENTRLDGLNEEIDRLMTQADSYSYSPEASARAISLLNELIGECDALKAQANADIRNTVASFMDPAIGGDFAAASAACPELGADKIADSTTGASDFFITRTSLEPIDPGYYSFPSYEFSVDAEVFYSTDAGPRSGWHTCRFKLVHQEKTHQWLIRNIKVADRESSNAP